jgi:hypothetical protein
MSNIKERLKEPFVKYSSDREELLDSSWNQLVEHEEAIRLWPSTKKRLQKYIIEPLKKWTEALKRVSQPLNLKRYKKVKRRLLRARFPSIFSWSGFSKKFYLFYLRILNIIRILFILFIYFSIMMLFVFMLIKVFKMIKP